MSNEAQITFTGKRRRKRTPLAIRFWAKVDRGGPDECWEWTASRMPKGYGQIGSEERKTLLAHRVSYELHNGPIPADHDICHRCDNPPCVNPGHLFLGSRQDNMRDCSSKGRVVVPATQGERNGSARLTEAQAIEILTRHANGERGSRLASEFGVTHAAVSALIHGHTWGHLTRSIA